MNPVRVRVALVVVGLALVLGTAGLLVLASGVVPVKASSGHWGITRVVLTFAMRRSVETRAMMTRVPDLDRPALVLRGAAHYDRVCVQCHGAPGVAATPVMRALTPQPPHLPDTVVIWQPAELFQIVMHGVKMTGMPAWPAREREDEVWAVVAFLTRLPGMEPDEYRRLARGEERWVTEAGAVAPGAPEEGAPEEGAPVEGVAARLVRERCAVCHGPVGGGRGEGAFPKIGGQSPEYLAVSLRAYAAGARPSGIMSAALAGLDSRELDALARFYGGAGAAAAAEGATGADPALLERGERIARAGIPARKVPACVECHGPVDRRRNPRYPRLAGQYADYLALQLRLFAGGRRGGSDYAHIMREATHRLEPEEARAVAAWYAALPWAQP